MADKIKKPRVKKTANVMSPPVPTGTTLQDLAKEKWIIGPAIGQGGFGIIYSARNAKESAKDFPYVVKFEPHGSGPLFVERNFYLKVAKETDIKTWVKSHSLSYLGLPRYLGSGSHEIQGVLNRFLVTDRYNVDLWSKFLENNRQFPLGTVLRVALQVLDVLEYIHSTGYVHMDVKASNLMLGREKASLNHVFLIDFGLVTKATTNNEYKRDPKQAHNGTIEYLSRDAHDGVPSMRGDLEVLGFNMLHWRASTLPWEKVALTNTKGKELEVQKLKVKFMDNVAASIKSLKLDSSSEDFLTEYLTYVKNLKHDKSPDYKKVQSILQKALKITGISNKGPFIFLSSSISGKDSTSRTAKQPVASDDEQEDEPKPKQAKAGKVVSPRRAKKKNNDSQEDEPQVMKEKGVKVGTLRNGNKTTPCDNEQKEELQQKQKKGGKGAKVGRKSKENSDSCSDSEEEVPVKGKKVAAWKVTKAEESDSNEIEEPEQKKTTSVKSSNIPLGKGKKATFAADNSSDEEDVKPKLKRIPTPRLLKSRSKAKATAVNDMESPVPDEAKNKRIQALVLQSPLSTPGGSRELKLLKMQTKLVMQTPEISDDETPKRRHLTPRSKLLLQTPEITDDDTPQRIPRKAEDDTPKGVFPKGRSTAKPVNYQEDESDEEFVIDGTPTPPKKQRLGRSALAKLAAENEAANMNGTSEEEQLPKWKQCSTIQASNVDRPGEYIRQNSSDAKNKKK